MLRRFFLLPFAEKWLLKRLKGAEPKSWLHKFPPNHYQYPQDTLRKVKREGISYRLNLADYVHWRVFWGMEKEGKNALFAMLKAGDNFVDVGANIGEICLKASEIVGEKGIVWAFEPIEQNLKFLRYNLGLNPRLLFRVQVFPFALGAEKKDAVSFSHPRNDNLGMIRVQSAAHPTAFVSVPMQKLDNMFPVEMVNGIKIDVEGYELQVLRGAERLIQEQHPWLFIEVDDANLREQGDSAEALLGWLGERGYQINWIGNRENGHGDILAIWSA